MKKKVLILFGGKSVEHDISIITALQTMAFLPEKYEYLAVYIDRSGTWWTADNMSDKKIYTDFDKRAKKKKKVSMELGHDVLLIEKKGKYIPFCRVLSVLNCCHGHIGEDGCVQGIFESCFTPQTSCKVASSALCMDKVFLKDVLRANGIATPDYFFVKSEEIDNVEVSKKTKRIGYPVVVKPARLGSSIGVCVCKDEIELFDAIKFAFEFDDKVLVEKKVENLREFNCACLMYKGNYFSSKVSEVELKGEIYSFENKYVDRNTKTCYAKKGVERKIKALTEKVYKIVGCSGVVRVDFLYDEKEKKLFLNEINTIPGSLAFYLFKDISFKQLLECLIEESVEERKQEEKLTKTFENNALDLFEKMDFVGKK